MFAAILIFITVFVLVLVLLGFLVLSSISVLLTAFGVAMPVFGVIHYLASGFLLVYTKGYFNKDSNIFSVFKDTKLKFNKE